MDYLSSSILTKYKKRDFYVNVYRYRTLAAFTFNARINRVCLFFFVVGGEIVFLNNLSP